MAEAGLEPDATTVMLSGAASVMPVVRELLAERTGARIEPVTPAKGAVPLGALRALETYVAETPTASAGWRSKATRLEALAPIKLPTDRLRLACLTPDGELAVAWEGSVALMSGAIQAWEQELERPSWSNDDFPTALACAPDGTVAVGTHAGQLISIGPGGGPTRKLIEARFFSTPSPVTEITFTWLGENGVWMVAREDKSVLFVSPEGAVEPLNADMAAQIDTMPLRLATLPGFSNVALLTYRRLLLFSQQLTVVENSNPDADSSYWHLSIGHDGAIAVAHADGTIDLIGAWTADPPIGRVGGFQVADAYYPHVALLAERVLVLAQTDSGQRVDLFDRDGNLLTQTEIENLDAAYLLVDRKKAIVWVVGEREAHRFRLVSG
jgi:hypothetical protein